MYFAIIFEPCTVFLLLCPRPVKTTGRQIFLIWHWINLGTVGDWYGFIAVMLTVITVTMS